MIHIDRARKDDKGRWIKPKPSWFKRADRETQAVTADPEGHEFQDSVYAHDYVRMALEELFHRKCAYCETILPEGGWDVDHFRPKGRVAENKEHLGYYWLAYEWKNLYPSCSCCNQRRKDKPTWRDPTQGVTGGKADQFPLRDERTRAYAPDDSVGRESVLLIDPCNDKPERHLTFSRSGKTVAIDNDPRAEATRDICNLNRRRLREKRRKRFADTVIIVSSIKELKGNGTEAANKIRAIYQKDLQRNYLADNCEFAAVARAVEADPDAFGI